jgi:hypothetical protein
MFSSLYVYAGIAIVILGLIASIVRWWNLPAVVEQRRLATEARLKAQNERRDDQAAKAKTRNEAREKQRADKEAARQARRKRP